MEGDALLEVFLLGETHAVLAEDAEAVGFIKQEKGVVGFCQVDDFAERAEVAVHAEDGFGGDEDAGGG